MQCVERGYCGDEIQGNTRRYEALVLVAVIDDGVGQIE
jgi:hypothetical protein